MAAFTLGSVLRVLLPAVIPESEPVIRGLDTIEHADAVAHDLHVGEMARIPGSEFKGKSGHTFVVILKRTA